MSRVTGYFVVLTANRSISFYGRNNDNFAEPVPDFLHSRNIPLVCFIINEDGNISHVGLGKRGIRAGTDLRRLNIHEIFQLKSSLSAIEIVNATSLRTKKRLIDKIESGGLVATKSFEEFLRVFLERAQEVLPLLNKFSYERRFRIDHLSDSTKKSLAEQKEAVLTAMNIAGIDKEKALGWDYLEGNRPISFLDGLEKVKLREDSMIISDLANIPGFNLIKTTKYSSSVFENDNTRLTVLLANRLPLEELLGTDLIYYNEDFKCFIMVQYKVMEKENDKFVFRVPNAQLADEIARMDSIITSISTIGSNDSIDDFRISVLPFFIKICPRIEFDPDNVGLSSGMYIPLDYLKLLQLDESIIGVRGGRGISYENVGRYFDNTAFKIIIESGWIGTNHNQSTILENVIRNILENGRTAVLAIKKKIARKISFEQEDINEEYLSMEDFLF